MMSPLPVHIFDLPDELSERVILYLRAKDVLRLEATCKYARDQCRRLYWSGFGELNLVMFLRTQCRVDVSNAYRFDLAAAGLIKRCGPFLIRLDLSKFGALEYGLRLGLEHAVVEHCSQLRYLNLDNRLLDREWLIRVSGATGRTLRELWMSHVYIRNCGGLEDGLLGELLERWRVLETLVVRDNRELGLACYPHAPHSLRSLDAQGCSVRSGHVHGLMARCPLLDSLGLTIGPEFGQLPARLAHRIRRISVDSEPPAPLGLHQQYVNTALVNMTHVRSITINSHLVNDVFFKMLPIHLSNVEELGIPGARPAHLTSITFCLLELTLLPRLTAINMRGNPMARTLLLLCHKFSGLVQLDLSYLIKERDLIHAWPHIRSHTLRTLTMRGFCSPGQDTTNTTRRILQSLRTNCPNLHRLLL